MGFEDAWDRTGGKIGDKLLQGYEAAKDKAHWLATNTVDAEVAIRILSQGFTDFGASCAGTNFPSFRSFDKSGLRINFGNLKCQLTLMGQKTQLFDFHFGEKHIPLPNIMTLLPGQLVDIVDGNIMALMPPPLKLIETLHDCVGSQPIDMLKCLG